MYQASRILIIGGMELYALISLARELLAILKPTVHEQRQQKCLTSM